MFRYVGYFDLSKAVGRATLGPVLNSAHARSASHS